MGGSIRLFEKEGWTPQGGGFQTTVTEQNGGNSFSWISVSTECGVPEGDPLDFYVSGHRQFLITVTARKPHDDGPAARGVHICSNLNGGACITSPTDDRTATTNIYAFRFDENGAGHYKTSLEPIFHPDDSPVGGNVPKTLLYRDGNSNCPAGTYCEYEKQIDLYIGTKVHQTFAADEGLCSLSIY